MLRLVIDNTEKLNTLANHKLGDNIQFDASNGELCEAMVSGRNMIDGIPRVRVLCPNGDAFWIEAITIVNNLTRQEMK